MTLTQLNVFVLVARLGSVITVTEWQMGAATALAGVGPAYQALLAEAQVDAGIRYGGTVPEDMIAQRLSPDMRWVAAASPAYLERFGAPSSPHDLREHRCIRIRLGNDQLYQWEFERGEEAVAIATPGPLTVDGSHAALAFGLSGVGVIYGAEPVLRPYLDSGALKLVLDDWAPMGSGFHIYYSGRRQLPTALSLRRRRRHLQTGAGALND